MMRKTWEEKWIMTLERAYYVDWVEKKMEKACHDCAIHGRHGDCDHCKIAFTCKKVIEEIKAGERTAPEYAAQSYKVYRSKKGIVTLTLK